MILFTGRGTSGSWQVRGVQLGKQIGGAVIPNATLADCKRASAIVAVKRLSTALHDSIKRSGKPWVWDIVDAYPQPACTAWTRQSAINWVQANIAAYKPSGIIWPNKRMRADCDTGLPGVVLNHHYRPGSRINPIRDRVHVVGYEGSPNYLGEWLAPIIAECHARGWVFRINEGDLADWDIVIAARSVQFNGYVQRNWKSNVKLANAHGTGTPFIGPRECGYTETGTNYEQWADHPEALKTCFNQLAYPMHRRQVSKAFLDNRFSIEDAGDQLSKFLARF